MPFVAPCRQLGFLAPFGWLKKGMADLGRAPQQSLTYGLFMALIMAVVVWLAWTRGSQYIMMAMLGGFVFIAPLACIGLYAISAQLERGQEVSMARSLRADRVLPGKWRMDVGRPGSLPDDRHYCRRIFRNGYLFRERVFAADDYASRRRQHHRHRHIHQRRSP
jgi:hypothetical protein